MSIGRAARGGANGASDEEFKEQLFKGGELLSEGKVIEAKEYLERAHQLKPKDEKSQNLLGLAYFRLGMYERAAELYELLVRDNPADPTLRVNLGLVYLKSNTMDRAIREFEVATDLQPEHKKAQNYLGVALAQVGEYARAREHFVLAGSDAMADKMAKALAADAGEGAKQPPAPAAAASPAAPASGKRKEQEYDVVVEESAEADPAPAEAPPSEAPASSGKLAEDDWSDVAASAGGASAASAAPAQRPPSEARVAKPIPPPAASQGGAVIQFSPKAGSPAAAEPKPQLAPEPKGPAIREVARSPAPAAPAHTPGGLNEVAGQVRLLTEPVDAPFQVWADGAAIAVNGELLTRLVGLISYSGTLDFKPEKKRFRGRTTEMPFGEREDRVVRAKGSGLVVVGARKKMFLVVELGEESAYFREEIVFAFEDSVMFENGRVPSDVAPDLDLVHMRGKGKVLLHLPGPMRSMEISRTQPVTVPMQNLVGWHGQLTPRIVALLPEEGKSSPAGVELTGQGFALFAVPSG